MATSEKPLMALGTRHEAKERNKQTDNPHVIEPTKTNLNNIPLEILFEIASKLPDVRSAIQLSYTCRSIYASFHESEYFWFTLGCSTLKRFQTFDVKYCYRDYIKQAASGSFKTTCQFCMRTKNSFKRTPINLVLCGYCLDKNLVLVNSVDRIAGLDFTKIEWYRTSYPSKSLYPKGLQAKLDDFYWLPSVKREVEKVYKKSWKDLIATNFRSIRPLCSLKECIDYRFHILNSIDSIFRSKYRDILPELISDAQVGQLVLKEKKYIMADIWAPADGQTDNANFIIEAGVERLAGCIFGPKTWKLEDFSPIWPMVENEHMKRLSYLWQGHGKPFGKCSICNQAKKKRYTPIDYVLHVHSAHPEWISRTDWFLVQVSAERKAG